MGSISETIYIGTNTTITLQLQDDEGSGFTPVDLSGVTRAVLDFGQDEIDSDDTPAAFDWTLGSGKIEVDLASVVVDTGIYFANLTIYDSASPGGLTYPTGVTVQALEPGTAFTTTLSELFRQVAQRLSAEPPHYDFVTVVDMVVNHIDKRLNYHRSELLKKDKVVSVATGTGHTLLPALLLGVVDHPWISYGSTTKKELTPLPEDERGRFTENGVPEYYEVMGQRLYLYPTPDQDITLKYQTFERNMIVSMDSVVPYGGLFDHLIRELVVRFGANPVMAVDPVIEALVVKEVDSVVHRRAKKRVAFKVVV